MKPSSATWRSRPQRKRQRNAEPGLSLRGVGAPVPGQYPCRSPEGFQRVEDLGRFRPDAVASHRSRAASPGRPDRFGRPCQRLRVVGARLGPDQQICRRLSRKALLRRLHERGRGRATGHRPAEAAVRIRMRQRAAAFRRASEWRRHAGASVAQRYDPGHVAGCGRPADRVRRDRQPPMLVDLRPLGVKESIAKTGHRLLQKQGMAFQLGRMPSTAAFRPKIWPGSRRWRGRRAFSLLPPRR